MRPRQFMGISKQHTQALLVVLPIIYLGLTVFVLLSNVAYFYIASIFLIAATAAGVYKIQPSSLKVTAYWLLVLAAIGLSAAVILTIEKFELLEDPNKITSCSVSPIVACSPVIGSEQASAFGFANPVIGIFGFSAVLTAGMTILAGARKLHANWWKALMGGILFGVGFSLWLIFQAFIRIDALCLYCMAVWIVSFSLFWIVLAQMIREKIVHLGAANSFFLQPTKPLAITMVLLSLAIFFNWSEYWLGLL